MKKKEFNSEKNNTSLNDEKKIEILEKQINDEIKKLFKEMKLSYNDEYRFKINDKDNITEEYQIFFNRILKKYFNNVSENKIKNNYNNEIVKNSEISHKNNKNKGNHDDIFKYEKIIFLFFLIIILYFLIK